MSRVLSALWGNPKSRLGLIIPGLIGLLALFGPLFTVSADALVAQPHLAVLGSPTRDYRSRTRCTRAARLRRGAHLDRRLRGWIDRHRCRRPHRSPQGSSEEPPMSWSRCSSISSS